MVSPEDDEARFAPPVGPPVAYWYPPDDPVAAPNGWSPGIIPRPHTQPDIAPPTSPASPVTKRRVGLIASCGTLAVAVVAGIIAIAHSASSAEESLASGSAATASDVAAPSSVDSTSATQGADEGSTGGDRLPGTTVDAAFLAAVKDAGLGGASDNTYLSLAHQVCTLFDENLNFNEISSMLMDAGTSAPEAGSFVGLAAAAYCPHHNPGNW